jgi:hypothetical protein
MPKPNCLTLTCSMSRYRSPGDGGGQVNEFKQMVKTFHVGGIEVILDGWSSDGSADDELSHQNQDRNGFDGRVRQTLHSRAVS